MVDTRWLNFLARASFAVLCVLVHCTVVEAQTLTTQMTQVTQTPTVTQTMQVTEATMTTDATDATGVNPGVAGVIVDASGVLRTEFFQDRTGQLARQRMAAARAALAANNPKLVAPSPLRKISLNRLEAAVKKRIDAGQKPTEEMKYLAGLTRVQFVFYYPDTKDIVVAGPAEGWVPDMAGRVRGLNSHRPVVELDDLVTALRAFPPGGKATSVISCSIDPTQEGLQRMQEFVKLARAKAGPGDVPAIIRGLKESLGPQTVNIRGVPATTHFAQVLVEADYRMKLIGIGLEKPPLKQFQSWIDRVSPAAVSRNALQRWFFVPHYDCVAISDDGLAMELVGGGVKLVNADELVAADGSRAQSSTTDASSRGFTETFTKRYADLAAVSPVYAQLRNCIDLAVAAAYIQQKNLYGKAGWTMPLFGEEATYPVQTLAAPQQVDCILNVVSRRGTLMTPIGGGVSIQARKALDEKNLLSDDEGRIAELRTKTDIKDLPADQWWWD